MLQIFDDTAREGIEAFLVVAFAFACLGKTRHAPSASAAQRNSAHKFHYQHEHGRFENTRGVELEIKGNLGGSLPAHSGDRQELRQRGESQPAYFAS